MTQAVESRTHRPRDGGTPDDDGASSLGTSSGRRGLRWALVLVIGVLSVATLAALVVPELAFVERAPNLDVAMGMATTLAALAIAVLAWVRYGEGERHAVYEAAAFFVLFVGGALEFTLVLSGLDREVGASIDAPGAAPLYLHVLQRLVAAVVLVAGGYIALRGWRTTGLWARGVFVGPAVGVGVVSVLIVVAADALPSIMQPAVIADLVRTSRGLQPDQLSVVLTLSQTLIGALLIVAAVLYARMYERTGRAPTAFLSVGLTVAAFAQLHFALAPGAYTSLFTSWDLLRAVFFGILLAGAVAGARQDLRSVRRAKQALEESEERYRTLFQDAPEPILLQGWDGRILDANRAASNLYGRAHHDLVGRMAQDISTPDRDDQGQPIGALQEDGHGVFRGRGIRADGSTFPQEEEVIVSSFGGEERLLVQVRDMTERERMQAELLQAQKMEALGQLISGVAHELNNPLSAIIAFSQLLHQDERLPSELHHDAGVLTREAERTRRIVANLLDFARRQLPERRPTSLRELVDRTLELPADALGRGHVETVVDIPDDLPPVDVDPGQLQQVLLNLTLNAVHAIGATRGHGRITITAGSTMFGAGERVRLRFTDDGPGVPPDVEPHLFEPFFTTKAVGEGTGLGLSVSYGIVASHGGRLWHEPAPGGGASFVVEIPAVDVRSEGPVAVLPTSGGAAAGSGQTTTPDESRTGSYRAGVLAVDDEPSIRDLLTRALGRAGYAVTVAPGGAEALEILGRARFDVMLVDHRMVGMDGLECYERAIEVRPELRGRTAIMSGDTLNPTLRDFAERHSLSMLPKPFDVESVVTLVDELLLLEPAPARGEDGRAD